MIQMSLPASSGMLVTQKALMIVEAMPLRLEVGLAFAFSFIFVFFFWNFEGQEHFDFDIGGHISSDQSAPPTGY